MSGLALLSPAGLRVFTDLSQGAVDLALAALVLWGGWRRWRR